MERVIIIAPPEIDVSEAVKILKSDGVEVSVVAPSPANFLHFALGMIPDHPNDGKVNDENDDLDTPSEEPETEVKEPEAGVEEPEEPAPSSEDNANEQISFGECIVNGERISTFITTGIPYIEVENLSIGLRNNFRINESSFSFWNTTNEKELQHAFYISHGAKTLSSLLEVRQSDGAPRLFLTEEQATKLI